MNITDSISSPVPSYSEIVLGIDAYKFAFGFHEHTRFVRQIFHMADYASNPNAALGDEQTVTELESTMKTRGKHLQDDEEAWQIVKESVRQRKHDRK